MKKTYIQTGGKLIERTAPRRGGLTIIPDIGESFRSPVDNSIISSRADLREHNARNDVIDVGNDPSIYRAPPPTPPQGVKSDIIRSCKELGYLS